ncbi:MAG TPA: cation transporter dimerization domain-containing protein, partial [Leptospiraceae bacterium]|nr:cation transporter dimerization domain-containing protein [Leptospiraceae bacterium]
AFIIAFNAYNLFRPAFSEIMDSAPSKEITEQIRAVAFSVEGVIALHKCYVRKMGFDYFVDLHVLVDAEITVREGHTIGHAVKDAIRKANSRITDVLIHVEPAD